MVYPLQDIQKFGLNLQVGQWPLWGQDEMLQSLVPQMTGQCVSPLRLLISCREFGIPFQFDFKVATFSLDMKECLVVLPLVLSPVLNILIMLVDVGFWSLLVESLCFVASTATSSWQMSHFHPFWRCTSLERVFLNDYTYYISTSWVMFS